MSALDDALSRLGAAGIEYGAGFSNHGPMAVEALAALGREDAIPAFADAYGAALEPGPGPGRALGDEWPASLGHPERMADWTAHFEAALGARPWPEVLERWVPRLAPGMVGAAAHGWLRAAHAVRAIGGSDTAVRRLELARGLAYWAVSYTTLPGARREGRLRPGEALRAVPLLPPARPERLLTEGVARLGSSGAFADAVEEADLRGEPGAVVSELTRAAAERFLANARRGPLFAAIHMVTASSALRLVIPHVSEGTARTLLWYGWQATAGLYAPFGVTTQPAVVPAFEGSVEALVARAVSCHDEHGIKFTEACLREHAASPDPIYLTAADALLDAFETAPTR